MQEIRNVVIIGLGAIGSIYAAKLQQYDSDCLRVLIDASRLERYQSRGIVLNGVHYDFNYVLPAQHQQPADLILIATKADALSDAIAAIAGFVYDGTIILSLLNGITSEEMIAERYGWDKVLHAYFVGHGSTRSGNEIVHDGVGRIVFGDANGSAQSPRVDVVRRFFDRAGIDYDVPEDILFSQWCKFVVNVGINQVSAVLRAAYGDFQRSQSVYAIALELMQEVVAIAHQVGIRNADALLAWANNFIPTMPPEFKSSMLQDIEAGSKTEVEMFGGAICALGEKYGIPTPQNATFLKLIRALEEMSS
ncbi:MAG: ketopantoate reductase family protein [Anaerolineae bacterium]|nr:ketopantoate reductase family protein [Anaerolineae bacterium]